MVGVDVIADPEAGVGELEAGGQRRLGEALRDRAGVLGIDDVRELQWLGVLLDPAADQLVVVVAAGERDRLHVRGQLAQEWQRVVHRRADRRFPQLQEVAQDDQPVDVLGNPLDQGAPEGLAAEQIGFDERAEVHVRDHEGAH